jgi:serine/threonine-protein kinase
MMGLEGAPGLARGVIGNYALERELGRGGMGVVYAAIDQTLGKRVAIKVLLPQVSQREDLVQRFFNEARAASAIQHPGIVEVFHYSTDTDGTAYIVMEHMEGTSLAARLRSHGLLSIPAAVAIARQTALALSAAHRAGIVHRDLKPDNIFLVPDAEVFGGERVKLLDFGVAKLADPISQPVQTVTGAILGTPQYMSPEQCEGARVVDHRSDLYSLGCTLFQMVTGRLPFVAAGMGGMIGAQLYEQPPRARDLNPLVSEALDAVIDRLLAKAPEARFQSGDEVAAALSDRASGPITAAPSRPPPPPPSSADDVTRATESGRPQPRRRRWLLPVIGFALAACAGAAVVLAMRGGDDDASSKTAAANAPPADAPPSGPHDAAASSEVPPDAQRATASSEVPPDATPSDVPSGAGTTTPVDEEAHAQLVLLRKAARERNLDEAAKLLADLERAGHTASRDERERIKAELHALAVERAVGTIKSNRDAGRCEIARTVARSVAAAWGPDPALDSATTPCKPRETKAAAPPDPGVVEIQQLYAQRRYRDTMTRCITRRPPAPIPSFECIHAACKSDRVAIAAALLLRGATTDTVRALDECRRLGYDVRAWLEKPGNRELVTPKRN